MSHKHFCLEINKGCFYEARSWVSFLQKFELFMSFNKTVCTYDHYIHSLNILSTLSINYLTILEQTFETQCGKDALSPLLVSIVKHNHNQKLNSVNSGRTVWWSTHCRWLCPHFLTAETKKQYKFRELVKSQLDLKIHKGKIFWKSMRITWLADGWTRIMG